MVGRLAVWHWPRHRPTARYVGSSAGSVGGERQARKVVGSARCCDMLCLCLCMWPLRSVPEKAIIIYLLTFPSLRMNRI